MSAITYDNSSVVGFSPTNTFSFPFTVGSGINNILLLGIYFLNIASQTPSTPTVDGNNMGGVASNSGPTSTFGGLFIYSYSNPGSGSHTVAFNFGSDTTPKAYAIYSYFNVGSVDTANVNQGGYSSGVPWTNTLTSGIGNALIWSMGGGFDGTSHNPSFSGPPNNFASVPSSGFTTRVSGAGDFGVQATPTAETSSFGANPGSGTVCIGMVSLAPVPPPTPAFLLNFVV